MPNKNQPGGCPTCCDCVEIDTSEITPPCFLVSGYEFQGWSGDKCCKCARYVHPGPAWNYQCGDGILQSLQIDESASWNILGKENLKPAVVLGYQCPDPYSYCCPPAAFTVGTHSWSSSITHSWKLVTRWRVKEFLLCFSRKPVSCDGGEPQLKWVIWLKAFYEIEYKGNYGIDQTITNTVSATHPCFEKCTCPNCNTAGFSAFQPCAACNNPSCSYSVTPTCDWDYEGPPSSALGCNKTFEGSLIATLDRVKLFDTFPTGNHTFTNADTPENCTWSGCGNGLDYSEQICLIFDSYSGSFPAELCSAEFDGQISAVFFKQRSNCSCGFCKLPSGWPVTGLIDTGDEFCAGTTLCCDCPTTFENIDTYCPGFSKNTACIQTSGTWHSYKDDPFWFNGCDAWPCAGLNAVGPLFTGDPDAHYDQNGGDGLCLEFINCFKRKDNCSSGCDTTCCNSIYCPEGNLVCLGEKFLFNYFALTQASFPQSEPTSWSGSITCTLNSNQICISWTNTTINFSC